MIREAAERRRVEKRREKGKVKRRKGVTPGQRHRVRMKVDTEGGRKNVVGKKREKKKKKPLKMEIQAVKNIGGKKT